MPLTPTPRSTVSAARLALREFLPTVEEEDIIAYDALSEIAGCNVKERTWILAGARHDVASSHNIEFDTVYKVGIKRLAPSGRVRKARGTIAKIHSSTSRGQQALEAIPLKGLAEHEQALHLGLRIAYGHMSYWSSDPVLQAMTTYDAQIPAPPKPDHDTIRSMFQGT